MALDNNPLLSHLFTFDGSDTTTTELSPDCDPLELELGSEVTSLFEGFELNNDVAAAVSFTAATLSTFKNGLGKFSSSAKAYSGEGWLLSTRISSGLIVSVLKRCQGFDGAIEKGFLLYH